MRHQDNLIEKLEKDRTELLAELRKGSMHTAAAGMVFMDCTEEQTRKVSEYAERLVRGDDTLPVDDQSKELSSKVKILESELNNAKQNYYHLQVETDEFKQKYMDLLESRKTAEFGEIIQGITDLKVQYVTGNQSLNTMTSPFNNTLQRINSSSNNNNGDKGLQNIEQIVQSIHDLNTNEKTHLAQILYPQVQNMIPKQPIFGNNNMQSSGSSYSHVTAEPDIDLTKQLQEEANKQKTILSLAQNNMNEKESELKQTRAELEIIKHKLDLASDDHNDIISDLKRQYNDMNEKNEKLQEEYVQIKSDLKNKLSQHTTAQSKLELFKQNNNNSSSNNNNISNISIPQAMTYSQQKDLLTYQVVPEAIKTLGQKDQQAVFLGCFEELIAKDEILEKTNQDLEIYKLRFHKLAAQQQILYEQFSAAQVEWAQDKVALNNKVSTLENEKDLAVQELDLAEKSKKMLHNELEKFKSGDNSQPSDDERINDMNRAASLERELLTLTVNHKVLSRSYNAQKSELQSLKDREINMNRELLQMESVLRARIVELEELTNKAEGRADSLEELTRTWVPREDLIRLAHQHQVLKSKYAEMIATKGKEIVTQDSLRNVQLEMTALQSKYKTMDEENNILKENEKKLTLALEKIQKNENNQNKGRIDSAQSLLAQLTSLQVKYDMTEQRAKRAQEMKITAESISNQLQEEMADMERRLEESHHKYIAEHELLETLRSDLEGTISYNKAVQMHKEQDQLRQETAKLRAQVHKYRSHAELAVSQAKEALDSMNNPESAIAIAVRDGLKQALFEVEKKSDEKAIVGKLHRQLILAKQEKREAEQKFKKYETDLIVAETNVQKLQTHLESRNADIFRVKSHYRISLAERDRQIVELQSHVSQALTLKQAETLTQANASLSVRLENERQQSLVLREQIEKSRFELEEMKVRISCQEELLAVSNKPSSSGNGSSSYASYDIMSQEQQEQQLRMKQQLEHWNKLVKQLRLSELKHIHQIKVLEGRVEFLTTTKTETEESLGRLQAELVEKETELHNKELEFKEQAKTVEQLGARAQLTKSMRNLGKAHAKSVKKQRQEVLKRLTDGIVNQSNNNNVDNDDDDDNVMGKVSEAQNLLNKLLKDNSSLLEGIDNDDDDDDLSGLSEYDDLDDNNKNQRRSRGVDKLHETVKTAWGLRLDGVVEDLRNQLMNSKKVIEVQKETITSLQNRIEEFKHGQKQEALEHANAEEVSQAEKERILNTAHKTIASLRQQLQQKIATNEKYQKMVVQAREQLRAQKEIDDAEIETLNEQLLKAQDGSMNKLHSALNFLDEMPELPKSLVTVEEMDDVINEKDNMISLLHAEINELQSRNAAGEGALSQHKGKLQLLNEDMAGNVERLEMEKSELIAELEEQRNKVMKQEEEEVKLGKLVKQFMEKLKKKDKTVAGLAKAIEELKIKRTEQAEDLATFDARAKEELQSKENNWLNDRNKLEKRIHSLQNQIQLLRSEREKDQEKLLESKQQQEDETQLITLREVITQQEADLKKHEKSMSRLRQAHTKAKAEIEQVREDGEKEREGVEKALRLSHRKLEAQDNTIKELQSEIKILKKKYDILKSKQEHNNDDSNPKIATRDLKLDFGSFGGDSSDDATSLASSRSSRSNASERSEVELIKSDKRVKILQQKVKDLKSKITSQDVEISTLKEKLDKEVKTRITMLNQFKTEVKSKNLSVNVDTLGRNHILEEATEQEDLAQKLYDSETLVRQLKKQIATEYEAQIGQLTTKNSILLKKLEKLNLQMDDIAAQDPTSQRNEIKSYEKKLDRLEGQLIETKTKLHELEYEKVTYDIEMKRIQKRNYQLTKYNRMVAAAYDAADADDAVKALKKANALTDTPTKENSRKKKDSLPTSKIVQLLGKERNNGKGTVIETLIKVIDKLKNENSLLTKSSASNTKYMKLLDTNKKQKKEIQQLNEEILKMGVEIKNIPLSSDQEVKRLNDSLRIARRNSDRDSKALHKAKLRVEELENDNNENIKLISELKTRMNNIDRSSDLIRQKRTLQTTIKNLEAKMDKQEEELQHEKSMVTKLTGQINQLNKLVSILNKNSTDTETGQLSSDSDLKSKNEILLQRVHKLTKENDEFRKELSALDGGFWDEIMALKKRYSQSVQLLKTSQEANQKLQQEIKVLRSK